MDKWMRSGTLLKNATNIHIMTWYLEVHWICCYQCAFILVKWMRSETILKKQQIYTFLLDIWKCIECAVTNAHWIHIEIVFKFVGIRKVACKCSQSAFYNAPFWMQKKCKNNPCVAFNNSKIVGRACLDPLSSGK